MTKRSFTEKVEPDRRSLCVKCRYFFITHEKGHPYGCRAFGFKSRHSPYLVVRQASGEDCGLFEAK